MILVVGATGQLGGMIAHQLLEQGEDVRVFVREGSDYQALVDAGAEAAFGDLKEPETLGPACEGFTTLITTANTAQRGGFGSKDTVEAVDLRGNRDLIDAAELAGVEHFIFTSALGSDPDSPVPFMAAKGKTEAHLRESSMTYTILAPDGFAEVWIGMIVGMPLQSGQPVTLVEPATHRHTYVSVGDVAAFAVAAVDHTAAQDAYIAIGGPEALSWRDIVAKVEDVLGQDVAVRYVSPGEPIPGLPDPVPQLFARLETYENVIPMGDTARTFGVELTPVEEVIRQMFRGGG